MFKCCENKEKLAENAKRYREKNKEKIAAQKKKSYERNMSEEYKKEREVMKEYFKQRNLKNVNEREARYKHKLLLENSTI